MWHISTYLPHSIDSAVRTTIFTYYSQIDKRNVLLSGPELSF